MGRKYRKNGTFLVNILCRPLHFEENRDTLAKLFLFLAEEMRIIMNKCKFCQAEMAENGTFCPACGKDNNEEMIAETPVEKTSVMETPVEEISDVQIPTAEDIVAQEEAFVEAMPKPSTGKIGLAIAAFVFVIQFIDVKKNKGSVAAA